LRGDGPFEEGLRAARGDLLALLSLFFVTFPADLDLVVPGRGDRSEAESLLSRAPLAEDERFLFPGRGLRLAAAAPLPDLTVCTLSCDLPFLFLTGDLLRPPGDRGAPPFLGDLVLLLLLALCSSSFECAVSVGSSP